ncbi:hypothetical protein Mgra_00006323 [Meloidogyne graminicola]|uniref:Uncharacterized protein n=1 Tax=Meloidogyne graminicola TaxID=189291 RepID=A0A8S9ZMC5_9BILA|nr:hypothetical protein Mgra_00006323 [Meloidogyne graminicola]
MHSFWRLLNKPRIDDWNPLAKFFYADDALNIIAQELDSFDGRRDPERCSQLVSKLRQAQDRVLHIISEMVLICFPHESERTSRDYRVKFPDEIVHDNLPGQLWFGAECLAAGSNIVDRESESESIRPMAKTFVRHLEKLRDQLKEQAIRDPSHYPDSIRTQLQVFDRLFAEFEFAYVSAMVPVKSVREYDRQLDVAVLFSDCLTRAIKIGYISKEQIDDCDPNIIIALPRLAIIWGLLYYPDGALDVKKDKDALSEMFRHFHKLLIIVRNLLLTLSSEELCQLELKLVTGSEDYTSPASIKTLEQQFECDNVSNSPTIKFDQQKIIERNSKEYDPRDDFPEPGIGYVMRNPRCSQLIPLNAEKSECCDRSLYGNSDSLIHRLFVCVAGIADQLQTNYSSEVRKVLKMVLQPVEYVPVYEISGKTATIPENEEETGVEVRETLPLPTFVGVRWIPDSECEQCTACSSGNCSANQIAIPELGYDKKVRVCDLCFDSRIDSSPQLQLSPQNSFPSSLSSPIEASNNNLQNDQQLLNEINIENSPPSSSSAFPSSTTLFSAQTPAQASNC